MKRLLNKLFKYLEKITEESSPVEIVAGITDAECSPVGIVKVTGVTLDE